MEDGDTFARPDHVLLRVVAGEGIVLNTKTEIYFALDPVGLTAFEQLQEGRSISEAASAICELFEDACRPVVTADLIELGAKLIAAGLLVHQPPK